MKLKYLILLPNLPTNASLNAKIKEVKGEIPSITYLAANAYVNAKVNEVKVCPRHSNCFRFDFIRKKITYNFFVQYNKIHNLGITMLYQNRGHNFVRYYLICSWVNFVSISCHFFQKL